MKAYCVLIVFIFFLLVANKSFGQQPVQLIDNGENITLSNEYVQVKINKKKTLITSMKYKGLEMIGKPHINWNVVGSDEDESMVRKMSQKIIYSVRIDPKTNNGELAEVSFKYIYNGDEQTNPVDIDMRYALGKKDKGIYLSALLNHLNGYPQFELGQGRTIIQLNPKIFDFYTVDKNRRQIMPTTADVKSGIRMNVKEATLLTTGIHKGDVNHKYDYSTMLAQTPTWGWTSTEKKVGFWMINPSIEYMNGGPTQIGLTGHVEAILLIHWQEGHYGGGKQIFRPNEVWQKYIGPFYLYCNSGSGHDEMWKDALNEAAKQRSMWPYSWVEEKEYPQKQKRGILSGQIQITDPYVPDIKFSNMWVGLACTSANDSSTNEINWQYEGKNYQFWVRADQAGNFTIPNIRAGKYVMYAFADGILGEFKKKNITVLPGSNENIGKLNWEPIRYGKQLWEIGKPDRSAAEFRHGDNYWHWGLYLLYPKEFPNDVNFSIGKSDWKKDWNYCQPPIVDSAYKVVRKPIWTISFDQTEQVKGKATLRIAICGSRNQVSVNVLVNDVLIGNTGILPNMGVMHRDGIRGKEEEIALPFDAKLLKKGTNTIKLKLANVKDWTYGILYDYLRLELNESK